ncbi:MAG: glycosyltransferase family 2 protein [Hydrogenophaga sp.]|uniref:glycosyltransferase family 2 protein n=1 Tax=Hydrogenophaga sp. TaxID=1904254 RepID=UPI0025BD953A|nr:glycosyltransferase family A protein [Hydrogenophaga sp.]MBT9550652.1 glycosyltransferase family 2 protein [Hydrogenophaga sp.]
MITAPLFTVFTPTYNRAHLLNRVYESLKKQTCKDFEWLIVDDGSTDGTDNLVAVWKQDPGTDFPIRYIWQKNGHKKKAFNRGVKEAAGALFLPWDSDDEAVPNALETFRQHWLSIPLQHRQDFVGVCGLCEDPNGKQIGDPFPAQLLDSDSLEVRYRYGVTGEKWGFSRTDVLRQYPFPENIRGHVPEGIVWSAVAHRYQTRFISEVLRIYHPADDSITFTGKRGRHFEGHHLWANSILDNEPDWFRFQPAWFF